MDELHFGWRAVLKIISALLILGVWIWTQQEAKLDKEEREARDEAKAAGTPKPGRRMTPRSSYVIVAVAILFLAIAFFWGNKSSI